MGEIPIREDISALLPVGKQVTSLIYVEHGHIAAFGVLRLKTNRPERKYTLTC